MEIITIGVEKCQRCGYDHEAMEFEELLNATTEYNRWGMCPIAEQPLLLAITNSDPTTMKTKRIPKQPRPDGIK